jgi:hypothetical protein
VELIGYRRGIGHPIRSGDLPGVAQSMARQSTRVVAAHFCTGLRPGGAVGGEPISLEGRAQENSQMPFPIKFALSLVVILVAAAGFFYERSIGMAGPSYAILFLAPFMVVAMWIFPEVTRKK